MFTQKQKKKTRNPGSHDTVIIASSDTCVNTDVNIALFFFCRILEDKCVQRNIQTGMRGCVLMTWPRELLEVDPLQMCVLKLPFSPCALLSCFLHCNKVMNSENYVAMSPSTSRGKLPHSNALLCTMAKKERGCWEITQLSITLSTSASRALFSHYTSFICDWWFLSGRFVRRQQTNVN